MYFQQNKECKSCVCFTSQWFGHGWGREGGTFWGLPKSIFPPLKLDIRSFFVFFFFQLASILSMIYSSRHMGSHINNHLVVNRTENWLSVPGLMLRLVTSRQATHFKSCLNICVIQNSRCEGLCSWWLFNGLEFYFRSRTFLCADKLFQSGN